MNLAWALYQIRLIWCKIKKIENNGTGGGIQSVQPGTNIDVDNTDPKNPVVSATGGGVTEEFLVSKGAGSFDPGETFPANMTLAQAFKALLTDLFTPVFTAPSFSMSNNSGVKEVGETLTLNLTGTFNRGEIKGKSVSGTWNPGVNQDFRAGLPTKYTIDGTEYITSALSQTKPIASFLIPSGTTTYNGSVNYSAGPQPLDSNGDNYQTPLAAGTLNSSTTVTGYLRRFAGSVAAEPTTGAEVRTSLLSSSVLNTGNTFGFTTGTTNKTFVVAVPSNKTLLNAVNSGTNENLTTGFILSGITNVPDAAGTNRPYKVYILTSAVPFSTNYTINITVS